MDALETRVFDAFAMLSVAYASRDAENIAAAKIRLRIRADELCKDRRNETIAEALSSVHTKLVSGTLALVHAINFFATEAGSPVRCRPTPLSALFA